MVCADRNSIGTLSGALMTAMFLPLGILHNSAPVWQIVFVCLASVFLFVCGLTVGRRIFRGIGLLTCSLIYGALIPLMPNSPTTTFAANVLLLLGVTFFLSCKAKIQYEKKCCTFWAEIIPALNGAALMLLFAGGVGLFLVAEESPRSSYIFTLSTCVFFLIFVLSAVRLRNKVFYALIPVYCVGIGRCLWTELFGEAVICSVLFGMSALLVMPQSEEEKKSPLWEIFLSRPGRVMLSTFALLCLSGTFLLSLPEATYNGVSFIDAAFTAVSAVCVTGLNVVTIPETYTRVGQFFLMLLIQFGGLGIMSVTTLALHAMGKRISLRQEQLMTALNDTTHRNLLQDLALILKYTFIVEVMGAVLLAIAFMGEGRCFSDSVWEGIFTAVSGFCNAGFSLQSVNFAAYSNNPLALHTVAALIILGGLAPAVVVSLPRLARRQSIPVPAVLSLVTTAILLFFGSIFILAVEWNGVLAEFCIAGKVNNAWFQSATLRTAGFNSVDIGAVSDPVILVMVVLMFIGGSPGGTAGGIKTTTVALLSMLFWVNIRGATSVTVKKRVVSQATLFRAVTVLIAGLLLVFTGVLVLELTQMLPARDIIFEVTSAFATVGLSTGITSSFDSLGKIIIMAIMFTGRVGPLSLFMLLEERRKPLRYPEENISLT